MRQVENLVTVENLRKCASVGEGRWCAFVARGAYVYDVKGDSSTTSGGFRLPRLGLPSRKKTGGGGEEKEGWGGFFWGRRRRVLWCRCSVRSLFVGRGSRIGEWGRIWKGKTC